MKTIDIAEMLEAGVHFGHRPSRWHPNMKPYLFTVRNNVHIIDLERTKELLEKACAFLSEQAKLGKTILFVGTKRQAKDIVRVMASEHHVPYMVERWVGGFLTNFETVTKSVERLKRLKSQRDSGDLKKYTKKEQLEFEREITKLGVLFFGVEEMKKFPDVVVLLSVHEEKTALREAQRMNVPIVGVCDSNANPKGIAYPIPANDDAIKAVTYITDCLVNAVSDGRAQQAVVAGVHRVGIVKPAVEKKTPAKPAESEKVETVKPTENMPEVSVAATPEPQAPATGEPSAE